MTRGWGFIKRPCITLNNAVFRGFGGTTGTRQAIARALEEGTFIPSPHGNGTHHISDATRITTAEAARLQSFPDGWQFGGPKTKVGLQIGNACPPLQVQRNLEHVWSVA